MTTRSTTRRAVRARVGHYLAFVASALVIAFWIRVLRPAALGGPTSYIVIRGNSMLPTYASGDLVVVHTAATYQVSDVVAYRVPDGQIGSGLIVIHRIVWVGHDGFTLRGDNNPSIDPWTPAASNVVGHAWFSVPGFGRVLAVIRSPVILGAMAASVAAAIVVTWRPRERRRRRRSPAGVRENAPTAS